MIYTAYRGEHGGVSDLSTRHGAITFCNEFRTCEEYARFPNNANDTPVNPRVLVGQLDIQRPFINVPTDPFIEGEHLVERLGYDEALRIACKFADHIQNTNQWERICEDYPAVSVKEYLDYYHTHIYNVYFSAYPYFDCPEEVEKLRQLGYDGAITASCGLGVGAIEYRPFSVEQITVQYVIKL